VFASGATDDAMFLAMALVEGPTLRELIADGGLDPGRAVAILGQVAAALDAAHATGLVHRDITPGNVLIGPGEHAYLCDFGLSRAPGEVTLTATGQFLGTIAYVAPEQIQSEAATASGDRYALAAVLYECLTGEVPFPRPTAAATLYAQVTAPPPRVSAARPDLPAALDVVIARGLAKDPARRWPCAADLIEAARAALRSRP
jgi:serine/threonine-protein kinase